MELFAQGPKAHLTPLAERMRPGDAEGFLGQDHLAGPDKIVGHLLSGEAFPSIILWGPPGTGKTTLAKIIAEAWEATNESLSAVESGVKDIRTIAAKAAERRNYYGKRTVLFVDEIHRFSKSQQDALLPHIESGLLVLIGATTENPSFEVANALLSRCRVLRFGYLSKDAQAALVKKSLTVEHGLGRRTQSIADDALDLLIRRSEGDGRRLLNTLEVASDIAYARKQVILDEKVIEDALQHIPLAHDKAGDAHYNVVSALIKSMRRSDVNAACYWLARMLEAGEDPAFISRRLMIFAAEDIGNADPTALTLAVSADRAYRQVGLPEGALFFTQAVTYLACAEKSRSVYQACQGAKALVKERGAQPVPNHLKNSSQIESLAGGSKKNEDGKQTGKKTDEKPSESHCFPAAVPPQTLYDFKKTPQSSV